MASATGDLESYVKNCKKIVGAALNYMYVKWILKLVNRTNKKSFLFRDIVRERNVPVPELPLMFLKPTTSLIQEGQDIVVSLFLYIATVCIVYIFFLFISRYLKFLQK